MRPIGSGRGSDRVHDLSRRDLIRAGAAALGTSFALKARAQDRGERPNRPAGVEVLNPRAKVPVSFIIDDSTCLVNLAHFAIPQFAEVFPNNYKQDWRALPREIPDAFVRKFGEWCRERGIKGKYSVVPYPACVGWLDRELPGWSLSDLKSSLNLVRDFMMPDWDIHPEMVSHTRVVDTKTGKPYPEYTPRFMENWSWTDGRSADEIGNYLAYALRVLREVGLPCDGITTPGGFGTRALPALAQGTLQAVRDVFNAEIPHYFRHLYTDDRSVAPRVEYAAGLKGPNPECVVSIIGCTGDWFGGWDGLELGTVDQFITEDGKGGRLPEVINKGEPAVLVCHWPGLYFNGEETGFAIFQEVVKRLHATYDHLIWMKLSEISRYWAAKELTEIVLKPSGADFLAPFACPGFTVKLAGLGDGGITAAGIPLTSVANQGQLRPGTFHRHDRDVIACFDLPKGASRLIAGA